MSNDIPARLTRVKESAARLNELCDQASESVRVLEEFLSKECSVGIQASVVVSSHDDGHHYNSLSLCYGRWGNRFRVLLQWSEPPCHDGDDGITLKPWVECKREDKLQSLPLLADLITAIDQAVQSRIEKAECAIAAIAELTFAMTKPEVGNVKK